MAQEKVIDERLAQMYGEMRKAARPELPLEQLEVDITAMEDTYRKVSAEGRGVYTEPEVPAASASSRDATPETLVKTAVRRRKTRLSAAGRIFQQ